ncbi:MAG: hypothetical protein ACUVX9_02185 [Anaerolineae bacterium]
MQTPLHGSMPPFKLASNVVYFHDWRYVNHGGYRWTGPTGSESPLWTLDPIPIMHYEYRDMPLGLELEAKPAQRTEPVIWAEESDIILFGGSLIYDEGHYRLWYDCWPRGDLTSARMGSNNVVRYAESNDGMNWRFPKLGLVEYEHSRDNNIVNGGSLTAGSGYHGGCVFKDPSAPASERYKAFYLGTISLQGLEEWRRTNAGAIDPFATKQEHVPALFGGVSPDGLNWTALPEPMLVQVSDTHNICTYDVNLGKYVAFVRTWYMGRRTIGRTQSDDFRRFSMPEEIFWPDALQPPYDLWYANAKTLMPGTTDYHLMFPMRWSLIDDHFEFMLASSPDGIVWSWVPGGPVCKPGPKGAWDGGVVVPGCGLVSLPGRRMGMLVEGSPVPHKHPRRPPLGALGWAWWPEDRLVALKARQEASFALWPLIVRGRTVHLNFSTAFAGFVQVEVVGSDGDALPGRSFVDCDYLSGDCLDQVVSWRGETDLGHADGAPVVLRFRLRTAEVYAVRFY